MNPNIFLREKPVKIIIELRKCKNSIKNNMRMFKIVDCTYATYLDIIKKFEKAKLLNVKKGGRDNLVTLTKKGKIIADYIMFIVGKTK